MVTREQALTEREFHVGECTRKIGPKGGEVEKVVRCRRNGKTKTWKTRPDHFKVPVKRGLYECGYLTHDNANGFHVAHECPLHETTGPVPE